MEDLVSVIIVSYNHSAFIKECLDSIKNQTYNFLELIIIDDASIDNSCEVIKNWILNENYQARYIFNEKNIGLANSLNNCFQFIKGKYVKFISGDDFLHHDYLKITVAFLSKNISKNYGMVSTDTWAIDENSKITDDIADYNSLLMHSKEELRVFLLRGNRIAALTVLMSTDVLFKTGKFDTELILEDYDRWLKINEKYWIGYIPKKLSFYRTHGGNISTIKNLRVEEEILLLRIKFDTNCLNYEIINSEIKFFFINDRLTERLKEAYLNYRKRSVLLSILIKYNLKFFCLNFKK